MGSKPMPKGKKLSVRDDVDLVAMAIAVCDEPDPKQAWDVIGRDMRVIYRAHALRFLRALRSGR